MIHARFLAGRLVQSIPVLFGVTVVTFLLIHLVPGDPARTALGARATPEAIAELRGQWGLDRSVMSQYWLFIERLFSGDLGDSFRYQRPIGSLLAERLPVTLWLIAYAAVLSCLLAVPLALWAASRPQGKRDHVVRLISVVGLGIPSFWLGLVLIELVAVDWGMLPSAGFGDGFFGHLESLFLPSLTIASGMTALMVRSLRAEVLKVSRAEYVTTARSKGISAQRIRLRHVLRNALAPSLTVLTVHVSFLIGGTVVVERVFALSGVGDLMLTAIDARDFPVVQAVTLVLALIVVAVSILGDISQSLLDPRVEIR